MGICMIEKRPDCSISIPQLPSLVSWTDEKIEVPRMEESGRTAGELGSLPPKAERTVDARLNGHQQGTGQAWQRLATRFLFVLDTQPGLSVLGTGCIWPTGLLKPHAPVDTKSTSSSCSEPLCPSPAASHSPKEYEEFEAQRELAPSHRSVRSGTKTLDCLHSMPALSALACATLGFPITCPKFTEEDRSAKEEEIFNDPCHTVSNR
ncbi:uncharacterized protein LOC120603706 [Pteropus medius]|uniref:uncharacterized protein LOC120603706 n=1 Tax=Pteropus vampyrus TaxID=132908 RepID=UPI00196B601C|nr:uncharacterized protein LOC120603706 [Pteropus giganteus]